VNGTFLAERAVELTNFDSKEKIDPAAFNLNPF
jgi:hypothetical protein